MQKLAVFGERILLGKFQKRFHTFSGKLWRIVLHKLVNVLTNYMI